MPRDAGAAGALGRRRRRRDATICSPATCSTSAFGQEDHPHRHVHRRRRVHQRHHARATHGADRPIWTNPHWTRLAGRLQEAQMNRRDWLKRWRPRRAALPRVARLERGRAIETEIVRLNLRHTWTTTMSSSEYRDNAARALHLRRHHRPRRGRAHRALSRETPNRRARRVESVRRTWPSGGPVAVRQDHGARCSAASKASTPPRPPSTSR